MKIFQNTKCYILGNYSIFQPSQKFKFLSYSKKKFASCTNQIHTKLLDIINLENSNVLKKFIILCMKIIFQHNFINL